MPAPKGTRTQGQGRVKNVKDLREKATLLLSEETAFFEIAKEQLDIEHINKQSCEILYGVNLGTLNTWKNGIPKIGINSTSLGTLAGKINEVYVRCSRSPSEYQPMDLSFMIESDKYQFGELLGIQWRDTRRILDQRLYVKSLATTLLTMPTLHTNLLDDFMGLCVVWHMTPTLVDGRIEQRLVRSLLDICDPVVRNDSKSVFRCRWRLPVIKKNRHNKNITHYHYLGSVSYTRENETYTWLFEPKNSEAVEGSPDFPYFLTHEPNNEDLLLFGYYVSKCQDNLLYTSNIAICKVNAELEAKFDNSARGLLKYHQFIDGIMDNSIFESIEDAKRNTCCDNEVDLLNSFQPTCDALGDHGMRLNIHQSEQ